MKFKSKVQMMWDVAREQEKLFREGIPDIVKGIDTEEFFKMLRGAEYRRGKEDGTLDSQKEMLEKIDKIDVEKYNGEFCFKANSLKEDLKNSIQSQRKKDETDGSNESHLETRSKVGEEIKDEPMPMDVDNHVDASSTQDAPRKSGVTIIDVKVVGLCSKCRKEDDEIPKYTDGRIVEDSFISCISKSFGECKEDTKKAPCKNCGSVKGLHPIILGCQKFIPDTKKAPKGCGKEIELHPKVKAKCGEYIMSWGRNVYCDECEEDPQDELCECGCVNNANAHRYCASGCKKFEKQSKEKECEHEWEKFCSVTACNLPNCSVTHSGRLCKKCRIDKQDYLNQSEDVPK